MRRIALTQFFLSLLLACHGGPAHESQPVSPEPGPMSSIDSTGAAAAGAPIARTQSHLAAREYWASETDAGLQAPNRAHDLRSYFDARGVSVVDRDASERTPLVDLSLVGLGRHEALSRVPAGEVVDVGEGRVEIRRATLGLVEWFENTSAGLEQGFTLAERPRRSAAKTQGIATPIASADTEPTSDADLVVELSISGAHASFAGDRVRLATASGRSLDYGKLVVVDANDVPLVAHFEVPSADRIRIVVDDREATYPIVIDPLLTGIFDAVVASNQAGSEFGVSVASAGDVNGDGYDDVIVGATLYDLGEPDEGAAFVFLGSPTGIGNRNPGTAHAVLRGGQAIAGFGRSVAGAGDVNGDGYSDVVVGSYIYDAPQSDEGAAFVFHGSATGIASGGPASANGSMESNQAGAFLGFGIASAGDVNGDGYGDLIVGAHGYDAPEVDEGAAFILLGSATGIGNRNPTNADARLEGEQAGALFGLSVASAGDVNADGYADVIVGAPYFNFIFTDTGSAYLFHGSASGIANGDVNTAPGGFFGDEAFSRFGYSVASAGDVNGDGYADVIIGATFQDNGESDEGNAFVFHGSPTGLSGAFFPTTANRRLESNQALASYGVSVASGGDVNGDGYADVIVGSQFYDSDQIDEGVAFVYRGSATGVVPAALPIQYVQASAVLGYSVASAGDVNGDGFDDVIAGAFLFDGILPDEGAAFVFHGGALGLELPSNSSGVNVELQSLGIFVRWDINQQTDFVFAPAGDVNGDGFGDTILGVPQYDGPQNDSGAVFIVYGTATGLESTPPPSNADPQLFGSQAGEFFGFAVAAAGDVNGDGYGDVIVASRGHTSGENNEGAAFVFLGSATGIASGGTSSAHARLETNQSGATVTHVAAAGDVNGDGFGDVLISSGLYDSGSADEGAAFVFLGSVSGIANANPSTSHARFETDEPFTGVRASSAGDLNGDGYGDVVVHSEFFDGGEPAEGVAFVLLGSSTGIASANPDTAHARLETNQAFAGNGSRTYSPGDVNGDGFSDLVLTAPFYSEGENREGAAFIFEGSASGMVNGNPATADTRLQSNLVDGNLGYSRTRSDSDFFDVNADGYADVLLVSSEADAYLYTGSATGIPNGNLTTANLLLENLGGHAVYLPGTDFNGDGHGDLLELTALLVLAEEVPGQSELFVLLMNLNAVLGNESGRPVFAQQRRGDGSGVVVAPGGNSLAGQFDAELFARSPRGREYAKIEVEYCPGANAVFGGPGCQRAVSPSWTDLGTTGSPVSRVIPDLVQGTQYVWRARARYASYRPTTPGPAVNGVAGPWYRVQARPRAADIRIGVPEPGMFVALVAGELGIAAGAKRRRRSRARRG